MFHAVTFTFVTPLHGAWVCSEAKPGDIYSSTTSEQIGGVFWQEALIWLYRKYMSVLPEVAGISGAWHQHAVPRPRCFVWIIEHPHGMNVMRRVLAVFLLYHHHDAQLNNKSTSQCQNRQKVSVCGVQVLDKFHFWDDPKSCPLC